MRGVVGGLVCAVLGCAAGSGDGLSSTFGGQPQPGLNDDDEDEQDTDDEDDSESAGSSTTTGAEDGTTGSAPGSSSGTTDPVGETSATGSTTAPEGDSSSGAGDVGPQPGSGMWSHCLDPTDCTGGLGCLTNDAMTDGFCTQPCEPADNPAACGAGPVGTTVGCTTENGGLSICALDCMGGQPCPIGMACDGGICM